MDSGQGWEGDFSSHSFLQFLSFETYYTFKNLNNQIKCLAKAVGMDVLSWAWNAKKLKLREVPQLADGGRASVWAWVYLTVKLGTWENPGFSKLPFSQL